MQELNCKKHILALAIGAMSASSSIAIQAQSLQLEEVVVTAAKRTQSLQDVPMSVSALDSVAMADAGIQTMDDISRQVPVLEVQSNNSPVTTNYRIRRVGNLGNIPTFESAVGVFIDGAFRSRSVFGASELFDIERVEILRGPQSTLYGKNTTAGVIGIYTAAPTEEFTGNAELRVGNLEGADDATLVNFKGGLSGSFTDNLRGSLGVSYAMHDELMDQALANGGEDANETDRYSVRGQLAWDASEALDFRLIVGTVQQDDNKQSSPDLHFDPEGFISNTVLPTWQSVGISDTCSDNKPRNRTSCIQKSARSDLDAQEATLLANYGFDNGVVLNSITSWDYFDFTGSQADAAQMQAPLIALVDSQENESFQQEFRLTSAGGETLDWLAGVFYYTNEFNRGDGGDTPTFIYDTLSDHPVVAAINQALLGTPIPLPVATQGQLGFLDSTLDTEYIGIYGQTTWNISEAFSITAGLRWQEEEKDADITQWSNDPSPSIISMVLSPATVSGEGLNRKSDEVTWSVTPQWFVTENTMLFATAAHGFKSGGFNTGFGRLPIDSREFGDEDIMHYELGAKTELWESRVRLAASVFYTEYEDYQDAAFVGSQFSVGNAEKAELKGFEFEGIALLTEKLTTDFAVSYADFSYDKNTSGQCYPGRAPDSPTNPAACDLSGENPVNAPEWKTHIGFMYEQPVSWGDLYARADWSWTSEYNTSFSADPRLEQDAYSWVNLRLGSRWDAFEVIAWVDNATDETVTNFDAVVNLYAGDGSYQSFLQAPRSYGLTVRANF